MMPAELWRSKARCLGEPVHLFFPDSEHPARSAEARQICERCPVRQPCLQYAFDNHIVYGIFGGLSERERARMRRHPSPRCGTRAMYQKHGCRCLECCAANAAYQRDFRKVSA